MTKTLRHITKGLCHLTKWFYYMTKPLCHITKSFRHITKRLGWQQIQKIRQLVSHDWLETKQKRLAKVMIAILNCETAKNHELRDNLGFRLGQRFHRRGRAARQRISAQGIPAHPGGICRKITAELTLPIFPHTLPPTMFEQAFKNIDDVLWKDAGCTSELDYTEQTSWLLFLKYLDTLESDKAMEAELNGKKYAGILDKQYRWESWAAPKGTDGKLDHNAAMTGDDLVAFVNGKLFPYLHGFKAKATGPNTIEYKIGEIFGEIKNRIQSGYNLREIIDHIDELRFQSQTEKHELSHLYAAKIKNMGNAGRNGGEYYTPRPLIRAIVQVVAPKIGESIYDGALGSAGFLCESFDYLKDKSKLTTAEMKILQERTFYGKEKKSLAYVIAIMNMILHGIEAPNIIHTNTLTET